MNVDEVPMRLPDPDLREMEPGGRPRVSTRQSVVRFLSGLVGTLVVCAVSVVYLQTTVYESVKASHDEALRCIASDGAALIAGHIDSQFRLLDAYAVVPSVTRGGFSDLPFWLRKFESSGLLPKRLTIVEADGSATTSDGKSFSALDRDYFHLALAGNRVVSGPLISHIDGRKVVVLARQVVDDSGECRVLSATVDLADFVRVLLPLTQIAHAGFRLETDEGELILGYTEAEPRFGGTSLETKVLLTFPRWTLSARISVADFMSPVHRMLIWVGVLAVIFMTLIAAFFFRGLSTRQAQESARERLIANLRLANQTIGQLAYSDATTGLPNRLVIVDRLLEALRRSRKRSLLLLEVRDFPSLCSVYGIHLGDKVLRECSRRLVDFLPLSDGHLLGYLASAQFFLLIPDEGSGPTLAPKLVDLFQTPVAVGSIQLHVAVHVGFCPLSPDSQTPDDALKRVELALFQARSAGPNQCQGLSNEMITVQERRNRVQSLISQAWDRGEFQVYYQPQFDLETGLVGGYEALLRWDSAQLGPVGPSEFIPFAEETGFIAVLGRWVLSEGLRFCREMERQSPGIVVSVNVSAVQLHTPGFLDEVRELIRQTGTNPHLVGIEFTESIMIRTDDGLIQSLRSLIDLGIKVSLDDFGTGYSSLTSLHRIPLKVLKIDKRFVDGLVSDPRSRGITKSLIEMAHGLELSVIAEGVESEDQRQLLRELGCDMIQGYLTGRPAPAGQWASSVPPTEV